MTAKVVLREGSSLVRGADDSKSGLKRGVFTGKGCTDMKLSGKVSDKVLSYIFDKVV